MFRSAIGLFDNEEVGSASLMGAGSTLLEDVMRRVSDAGTKASTPTDVFAVTVRKSFLVSADMAHGLHPNYIAKHEVPCACGCVGRLLFLVVRRSLWFESL